jgi:hypothetical protein
LAQGAQPSVTGPFDAIFFESVTAARESFAEKSAVIVDAISGHLASPEKSNDVGHGIRGS